MKITLIILGVLVAIFIAFQVYVYNGRNNIESYKYKVDKSINDIEIRTYEATLFTSVKLPTSKYEKASGRGFSVLAGYIFGDNEKNEKISMTSPVTMSLDDSITMMFMVPKDYNLANLPVPNKSQIEFKEEPAKKMAAITFGGWADSVKIEKNKNKLIEILKAENIAYINRFYFFGYNPPFDLFFRRNEVLVELKD
jgi:hypothetical protein